MPAISPWALHWSTAARLHSNIYHMYQQPFKCYSSRCHDYATYFMHQWFCVSLIIMEWMSWACQPSVTRVWNIFIEVKNGIYGYMMTNFHAPFKLLNETCVGFFLNSHIHTPKSVGTKIPNCTYFYMKYQIYLAVHDLLLCIFSV